MASAMEEDDPVERVIDVFMAPALERNLFLLQYPLRPAWRPYDTAKFENIKIKPNQKKLEVDMRLDTQYVPFISSDQRFSIVLTKMIVPPIMTTTETIRSIRSLCTRLLFPLKQHMPWVHYAGVFVFPARVGRVHPLTDSRSTAPCPAACHSSDATSSGPR